MRFTREYFSQGRLVAVKARMPQVYARFPALSPQTRALRRLNGPQPRILDLGCGEGGFLEIARLMHPDGKVVAVDVGDFRLLRTDDASVDFVQWDLERPAVPLPSGSFDFINCAHVIEHLRSPDILMGEIARLLAPGGVAYIEAPDVRWTFLPHLPFLVGDTGTFNFWDDPTHLRPYSRSAIRRLIEMSGLICERTFYVRKWAHTSVLPLALLTRNSEYKIAFLHALLGLWCGALASPRSGKD